MATSPREYGTLVIAALLILALAFTGYWIILAVEPGGRPTELLPWFGGLAVAIMLVAALIYLRRTRT